jgi:FkbM family methyltransferase
MMQADSAEVSSDPVPFQWRSFIRNLQTHIPSALHEWRLDLQQWSDRARRRPHEADFIALRDLLPPDARCIDGGANRGQSIDSIHTVIGRAVRVTAFEPQRTLARRLTHRYRNAPGVNIVRAGIGDEPGEITLYVPSYRRYRFDGEASADEAAAIGRLRDRLWRFDPSLVTVESEQIPIVRVDDLLWPDRVHFIKLDVQQMELPALRGAKDLLVRDKPVLMIESPDEPTMTFLEGLGYAPRYYVDGKMTSARPPWVLNALFVA